MPIVSVMPEMILAETILADTVFLGHVIFGGGVLHDPCGDQEDKAKTSITLDGQFVGCKPKTTEIGC